MAWSGLSRVEHLLCLGSDWAGLVCTIDASLSPLQYCIFRVSNKGLFSSFDASPNSFMVAFSLYYPDGRTDAVRGRWHLLPLVFDCYVDWLPMLLLKPKEVPPVATILTEQGQW